MNQYWNQETVDQIGLGVKNKNAADCKDTINIVKQYKKILDVQKQNAIYIAYKKGGILRKKVKSLQHSAKPQKKQDWAYLKFFQKLTYSK